MLPSPLRARLLAGELTATPVADFGLRGRSSIYVSEGWCVSLIDRKSRFLRKDAQRFFDTLEAVRGQRGDGVCGHVMVRTAPVCSKARAWLAERDVSLERL